MKNILIPIVLLIVFTTLISCSSSDDYIKESDRGYDSNAAINRGDIVDLHGKVTNAEKLDSFILNIEEKRKDKIRITRYTIEGDPIFYDFNFDGKSITYKYDNSNDKFGSSNVKSTVCNNFTKNINGTTIEYKLEECTGKNAEIGSHFRFEIEQ
ncbi:DUF4362 domain-containing protein [Paenibacillus sp. URB8-2]|uniref:DUF4362 domain-containing protein n=1 Tax=Paenibacillus sp. URB8-2 TaxID=2741301 RepID=UPI0015B97B35|nr:DUF4362 domain-containing protein [Paenibacillus sp. URB8-2]BCG60804.1 hypothetical protein PUR_42290 [Paenibacillus sp. URB8-2]